MIPKTTWIITLWMLIAVPMFAERLAFEIICRGYLAYHARENTVREKLGKAPPEVYQQAIQEAKALIKKHQPESYGYHPIADPEKIPPAIKKLDVRGMKIWSIGQCNLIINGAFDAETGYYVRNEEGKWTIHSYITRQDPANVTTKLIAVEEQ